MGPRPRRSVDITSVVRAVLGAAVMGYVPGRLWVAVLMPGARGVERFLASIVLSVALMVLALYLGNVLLHIPVTGGSALGWSAGLSLLAAGILLAPRLQDRLVAIR